MVEQGRPVLVRRPNGSEVRLYTWQRRLFANGDPAHLSDGDLVYGHDKAAGALNYTVINGDVRFPSAWYNAYLAAARAAGAPVDG